MLINANLPNNFWGDAVLAAIYVRNRCVNTATDKLTPYEICFGKTPSVKHIRTFGCLAFQFIEKKNRKTKISPKSEIRIFTGYDDIRKAYRLYDPINKTYHSTCHVQFMENKTIKDINETNEYDENNFATFDDMPNEISPSTPPLTDNNITNNNNNDNPITRSTKRRASTSPATNKRPKANLSATTFTYIHEPQTYKEAMSSPEASQWLQAMKEEIRSLQQNNTWKISKRNHKTRALNCKWVYKIKYNENNEVTRFKARLVAKGYQQIAGIDYETVYAPVAKIQTLRLIIAISAQNQLCLRHFNFKNVFVQAIIKRKFIYKCTSRI